MAIYNDIPIRSSRNRLTDLLFADPDTPRGAGAPTDQVFTLPLRDLPLYYKEKIPHNTSTNFYLLGGELDVEYWLRDDDGALVKDNGKTIKGVLIDLENLTETALEKQIQELEGLSLYSDKRSDPSSLKMRDEKTGKITRDFIPNWRRLISFTSPKITEDVTYTIVARKKEPNADGTIIPKEVALHHQTSLRAGIDTALKLSFVASGTDVLGTKEEEITVDYRRPVLVKVHKSQEGITYQLVERVGDTWQPRSKPVVGGSLGEKADIFIDSDISFQEDTVLKVRAFRGVENIDSNNALLSDILVTDIKIWVRPDPALDINFEPQTTPLAYVETPAVEITNPQLSTHYSLYRYILPSSYSYHKDSADYTQDGQVTEAVKFKALKEKPSQFVLVKDLFIDGQLAAAGDSPLEEDSLLLVKAKKIVNGEELWLTKHLVALVRPAFHPPLSVHPPFFSSGEQVLIRLEGAQRGVGYQLKEVKQSGVIEIGHTLLTGADRGVGWHAHGRVFGMPIRNINMISSDFKVPGRGETTREQIFPSTKVEFFPLSPEEDTSYELLAIKEYTGLTEELSGKVTARLGFLPFNGQSDKVIIEGYKGIAGGKARTVEAWIRPAKPGPILIWGDNSAGAKWLLRLKEGGLLELNIHGANLSASENLLDGNWHHIACVLTPPDTGDTTLRHLRLYIDGEAAAAGSTGNKINTGQTPDLTIGNDLSTGFFEGDMAEIRLWEKALTIEELKQNRYLRLAGNEPGLVAYWKLNESSGTTFADSSGNSHAGSSD